MRSTQKSSADRHRNLAQIYTDTCVLGPKVTERPKVSADIMGQKKCPIMSAVPKCPATQSVRGRFGTVMG